MRVTDDQGREWQGRIEEFAPDNLVLLTKDRQRVTSRTRRSLRIDRPHDTLGERCADRVRIGRRLGLACGHRGSERRLRPGSIPQLRRSHRGRVRPRSRDPRRGRGRDRYRNRRARPERPDAVPARRFSGVARAVARPWRPRRQPLGAVVAMAHKDQRWNVRPVFLAAIVLLTVSGVALGQTSASRSHAADARPNDRDHRRAGADHHGPSRRGDP